MQSSPKKTKHKRACPHCGSTNFIPIQYGYPGPGAIEDSDKGKVHLGGCVIDVFDQPNQHCNDCNHDWVRN